MKRANLIVIGAAAAMTLAAGYGCSTSGGSRTATPAPTATPAGGGATWTPFATDTETPTISPTPTRTSTRTRTITYTGTETFTSTPVFTPVAWISTLGGYDINYNTMSTIYVAPVPSWGGIGNWGSAAALPTPVLDTAAVESGGYLYVVGGLDDWFYQGTTTVYSAALSGGTIGSLTTQTAYPLSLGVSAHALVTDDVYLFALGGYDGSNYLSAVYSAPISGGTVGTWTSQPPLPNALGWGRAVLTGGYVYFYGGDGNSGTSSSVYVSAISGGTLSSWTTTTAGMPDAAHGFTTDGSYVYAIGGWQYPSSCRSAPISGGGTLGSWTSTTGVPGGRSYGAVVGLNGFVYVMGGWDAGWNSSTVCYFAPMSGGSLSGWASGSPLAAAPAETGSAGW